MLPEISAAIARASARPRSFDTARKPMRTTLCAMIRQRFVALDPYWQRLAV